MNYTIMTTKAPGKLRFAAVAIDAVIFGIKNGKLHVLLSDVDRPPHYVNIKGFPGGIIDIGENADEAVTRHLKEKAGLKNIYTEQLYTFSEKERDKRNRVISVAYLCLVDTHTLEQYNVPGMLWTPIKQIGKLAYDHNKMFKVALERLAGKLTYTNVAQYLLPKKFTLSELQEVYEIVLDTQFDKRNFRKKILSLNLVKDTHETQEGVRNRPATLYCFREREVKVTPLFV